MKPMHGLAAAGGLFVAALTYSLVAHAHQPQEPFAGILDEHPAIQYANRPTRDRVALLSGAIAQGTATLTRHEPGGYLPSVLRALDISPESQLLVFSKTGIQRASTSPRNPRALYFNDSVVVGYIPGARFIEIAAHDPEQGVVFYTVDQEATAGPDVSRRTNCLTCHVSGSTLDVPGIIARSNFTNANGEVIPQLGFHLVDHRTPVAQRWGGWFVTGKYDLAPYGGVTHMGNIATAMHPSTDAAAGHSNELFFRWMETDAAALGYPSHDSDIAALMVFDHQSRAINLITRLGWEARVAAHTGTPDFSRGELRTLVDDLADYLLFVNEVPPPARLAPRPGFAAHFSAGGPKDSRGRSLREFDLTTRLLKYRCSYMIYSPAFDGLPAAARQAVYSRIRATAAPDVIEILRETKADWPASK